MDLELCKPVCPYIWGPSIGYIQEWRWLVGWVPVTAFKVQRKPDHAGNGFGSAGLFNLGLVWPLWQVWPLLQILAIVPVILPGCKVMARCRNTNRLMNENQALNAFFHKEVSTHSLLI